MIFRIYFAGRINWNIKQKKVQRKSQSRALRGACSLAQKRMRFEAISGHRSETRERNYRPLSGRISSNFLQRAERRARSKNVKQEERKKNGEKKTVKAEDGTRVARTSLADMTDTLFAFNYRVPCERNISRELFPPSLLRSTMDLIHCARLFLVYSLTPLSWGTKFRQIAVFAAFLARDSLVGPPSLDFIKPCWLCK